MGESLHDLEINVNFADKYKNIAYEALITKDIKT